MVNELSNGPCVALALRKAGGGAVAAARALVGPHEFAYVRITTFCILHTFIKPLPSHNRYAKQLRPTSLRALYGRDDVCNAVHSTDLADDAALEVDFFFSLMQ